MLEFYHNLEVSESVNQIQCTLLTDFDGIVHIVSNPSGLIDKYIEVYCGKNFFYIQNCGTGGWVISARYNGQEANMSLVIFCEPAVEAELNNGDNFD